MAKKGKGLSVWHLTMLVLETIIGASFRTYAEQIHGPLLGLQEYSSK